MTLLELCLSTDGVKGGTIHQCLPFIDIRRKTLGKLYNDTGTKSTPIYLYEIYYKGACIAEVETIEKRANIDFATLTY